MAELASNIFRKKIRNNNDNDNNTGSMKVSVIPIVIGALGTIIKNLEKRIDELESKDRIKIIQMTVRQKLARILRRVLET